MPISLARRLVHALLDRLGLARSFSSPRFHDKTCGDEKEGTRPRVIADPQITAILTEHKPLRVQHRKRDNNRSEEARRTSPRDEDKNEGANEEEVAHCARNNVKASVPGVGRRPERCSERLPTGERERPR